MPDTSSPARLCSLEEGNGMSSSVARPHRALAADIRFDQDMMHVVLDDGREVRIPLAWFPSLVEATESQRNGWRLIGNGVGIHRTELDEDLSVAGPSGGVVPAAPRRPQYITPFRCQARLRRESPERAQPSLVGAWGNPPSPTRSASRQGSERTSGSGDGRPPDAESGRPYEGYS